MKPIQIFEAAHRRFINKIIEEGFKIVDLAWINKNRYCIIFGVEKNLLVTFKRELFHSFGTMFINKNSPEEGDTINYEELKVALHHNIEEIYTILPNGNTYMIKAQDFLMKCEHWTNRARKEVRSAPIKEYEMVFKI